MYWFDEYYFEQDESRVYFMMDSDDDLKDLPTSSTEGRVQGFDNVSNEKVAIGSLTYSIASGSRFMLNSKDKWIKLKDKGGSQPQPTPTATSLAELTDVQLGTLADGDFLVYDEDLGKWKNGSAETVVVNYEAIENPPTINGVVLTPNTTLEDLGIQSTVDEPNEELIIGDGNNP